MPESFTGWNGKMHAATSARVMRRLGRHRLFRLRGRLAVSNQLVKECDRRNLGPHWIESIWGQRCHGYERGRGAMRTPSMKTQLIFWSTWGHPAFYHPICMWTLGRLPKRDWQNRKSPRKIRCTPTRPSLCWNMLEPSKEANGGNTHATLGAFEGQAAYGSFAVLGRFGGWNWRAYGLWPCINTYLHLIYITYFLSCTAYGFGEGHLLSSDFGCENLVWCASLQIKMLHCWLRPAVVTGWAAAVGGFAQGSLRLPPNCYPVWNQTAP